MGQYEARRRPRRMEEEPPQEPPRRPRRRRRRRRRNPLPLILLFLLVMAAVAAGCGYAYYKGEVAGSRRSADQVEVEIPQGAGTADIAAILEKEGAIGNSFIFRFYSKYKAEADGSYQYGSFTLHPQEG